MDSTRRVVTVDGEGDVGLASEPIPKPAAGEVLITVNASLVSPGSGAGPVRRRRADPDPERDPLKRGYQAAGIVDTVGGDVAEFEAGDRVACMGSGYAYHADAVVVPQHLCVPLPENVSFEEGAFNHLAATGLHTIRRGEVAIGEAVAVMGLGLVGQLTGQLARIAGARPIGSDLLPGRAEVARAVGFERAVAGGEEALAEAVDDVTDGRGIDCGVIAFGGDGTDAFEQLVSLARQAPDGHRYGRIVIVGGAHVAADFPTALGNMDVRAASRPGPGYHDPAWERGAAYATEYRGDAEWTTRRNLQESIRLIDTGKLDVETLITHRYPFEQAADGYDALLDRPGETLGVIFTP